MLSPPVYVNICHVPRRNTIHILNNGKGPFGGTKVKNKGKTKGLKSLIIKVNSCPGFARLNLNIIVNFTSSLDMGKTKKWRIFHLKPNLLRWQQSFLRKRSKSEMNVGLEEVDVASREFSVPPLSR